MTCRRLPAPLPENLPPIPMKKHLLRRVLSLLLASSATVAALAEPPPQQKKQAPGYYRMALGDFEVIALSDGYSNQNPGLLTGADPAEIKDLLDRAFVPAAPAMATSVNAFLVHTGAGLILFDTGGGGALGPTLGQVARNLAASGYRPDQVDTVILTHLHPDHVCGLLATDGQPVFPGATVLVSRPEADYWLGDAPESAAARARAALAPYIAAGRFRTHDAAGPVLPHVEAIATPGHTPGHTSYLVESRGQRLLVWGDIVHSQATQFARPDIAISFDTDQARAIATRKKTFALAVSGKLLVAGAHLPFPGLGHVRAGEAGDAFAWVPVEFASVTAALPQ